MTSSATIKQALGLEDITDNTEAATIIDPQPETVEPLVLNGVDVDDLVDDIRENARVNDDLTATAEAFTELYFQLKNVSVESFNESNAGIINYVVDMNFKQINAETPAAIKEARSEGDFNKSMNLSMEAADAIAGKAMDAIQKGFAILLEKCMELMERFMTFAKNAEPAYEAAIKKISEFVKNNSKLVLSMSSADLGILTVEGKFNESTLSRDIADFAKLTDYTTGQAMKNLDAFMSAVELKVKSATSADEVMLFVKQEAEKLKPMGSELLHVFLGGYEGRITNDRFQVTHSTARRQLNIEAEEVTINPRSLSNAVYATKELTAKTHLVNRQASTAFNSREAKIIDSLADKNTAEFGAIQPIVSLLNSIVRTPVLNATVCVTQSARIITVVMNMAKRLTPVKVAE